MERLLIDYLLQQKGLSHGDWTRVQLLNIQPNKFSSPTDLVDFHGC
jgi:hypothetical protein